MDRIRKLLPVEILQKYSNLKVADIERILEVESLTDDQKRELGSLMPNK